MADDGAPLATSQWLSSSSIIRAYGGELHERGSDTILLGELWDAAGRHYVEIADNRHLVTIAGSRAGKGVSMIVPNLLNYRGSVVCVDPKGENAAVTAKWRADVLGHDIVVLDPFGVAKGVDDYRKTFNPLALIDPDDREALDDVAGLADAIVVKSGKDPHWDESARAFLKGVMLLMLSWLSDPDLRSLPLLRQLVMRGLENDAGEDSFGELLRVMKSSLAFEGAIAGAGATIERMGDNERGGVLSNVARQTEFLESEPIRDCMMGSTFDPSRLKSHGTTVYLVLPEWRLGTHSRWLRLMIGSLLVSLQRSEKLPPGRPPVLFILDEMATLGHMESIERAAGYIAGFGVKLWSILQDLGQLKDIYDRRWETFLGNAGVLTAFGNTDATSLDYLSKRLGETEVERLVVTTSEQEGGSTQSTGIGRALDAVLARQMAVGALLPQGKGSSHGRSVSAAPQLHRTALMTADEVGRYASRESGTLIAYIGGLKPALLNRVSYFDDPVLKGRAAPNPYV